MTETMLAPMANRGGTPRNIVRKGTMITPPPRPRSDPRIPARNAAVSTRRKNSKGPKVATPQRSAARPDQPEARELRAQGGYAPGVPFDHALQGLAVESDDEGLPPPAERPVLMLSGDLGERA